MNSQKEIVTVIEDLLINFLTQKVIPLFQDAAKAGAEEALKKQNQKKLLTIEEVCQELHVSPPKVFGMLKSGQLDRKRIPGCRKTYISSEQLNSLIITIKPYKRNG